MVSGPQNKLASVWKTLIYGLFGVLLFEGIFHPVFAGLRLRYNCLRKKPTINWALAEFKFDLSVDVMKINIGKKNKALYGNL